MADGSKPRAVSGEIMTDPPEGAASSVPAAGDVIDAEYISLPSEPLHAESKSSDSVKAQEPAPSIGTAATRRLA